ncbi:MAG: GlcG/HbpS family heme-binding protein [Burkholderiales bacterium]
MSRVSAGLQALVAAIVFVAPSNGAKAQGVVSVQKLSAPLANEIVGESVANCAQKGYTVTAVVVDLDGVRQAMLRGNGAPIHTLDNAFYKAYSAASLTLARKEDSTKAVADRMAKSAPSTVPQTPLPNVTYGVGGVTIIAGGTPIGAIGVSGAPGGQFDEECARAALAKIRDRMK